jgi:cobyrinic acid a,c-diamide synthase
LRHHGDVEVRGDLLDLAVNVYDGPRPTWLEQALRDSLADAATYPDPAPARETVAAHTGRSREEVLLTAGAAEAFDLVARARPWRRPSVVHPQFTEPHALLRQAGHDVTVVPCERDTGFSLDPATVPDDADLVVLGNPTNPTGILHPAAAVHALLRPGRTVVVDEAFMDAVPGQTASLLRLQTPGLLVVRSLTKHWSIPGVRAGYAVGDPDLVAAMSRLQVPWSVSTSAIAATVACCSPEADAESAARASALVDWRARLEAGLRERSVPYVPSAAPFVLARPGAGVREALRDHGVAVRRGDTFPGLDAAWVRIAVRPPERTDRFLAVLDRVLPLTLPKEL